MYWLELKSNFEKHRIGGRVEVKMRRVFLMMAACCVLASPALAGGGVDLYLAYGDVVDGNYELGLGGRFSIGGTHWMLDVGATGYQTVEGASIFDDVNNEDIDVKYRAFDLGLRYLFYDGHKVRPYVGAGLTYGQASAVNMRIDSGLGLYGMAGLRVGKPTGINFMAELIYRWTEVQASYGLIDERDVTIGGFGLQVGMSFVFR
jgi:Outer membrane protein beta-barrel domain